jgi:hypothetical protein
MTKDELIEKYRDINVDHDWWDLAYEDFIHDMDMVGISLDSKDISFEGFYHQGSHASIEFSMNRSVSTFMEAHNLNKYYNAIYKLAEQFGVHMKYKNGLDLECESWEFFDACEDQDMNGYYQLEYQEEVDATFSEFEKDVAKIIEDYEYDLYKRLRDEYEYLLSDEVVWESIVANDLDEEWDVNINRGLQIGGSFL